MADFPGFPRRHSWYETRRRNSSTSPLTPKSPVLGNSLRSPVACARTGGRRPFRRAQPPSLLMVAHQQASAPEVTFSWNGIHSVFSRVLTELHRDSSYPMMGKDAWVAGADRGEAPGPKPGASGASPSAPPPATRILAVLEWWSSARSLSIASSRRHSPAVRGSGQFAGDQGFACAEQPPGVLHQEQVVAQRDSLQHP